MGSNSPCKSARSIGARVLLLMCLAGFLTGCSALPKFSLPDWKLPKMASLFGGGKEDGEEEANLDGDGEEGLDNLADMDLGNELGADADPSPAPRPDPVKPSNALIGSVFMVNPSAKFVLIEVMRQAKQEYDKDTEFMAYNREGRPTAKLKLSPERKGGYVVADIVEGTPRSGDTVILHGGSTSEGQLQGFDSGVQYLE